MDSATSSILLKAPRRLGVGNPAFHPGGNYARHAGIVLMIGHRTGKKLVQDVGNPRPRQIDDYPSSLTVDGINIGNVATVCAICKWSDLYRILCSHHTKANGKMCTLLAGGIKFLLATFVIFEVLVRCSFSTKDRIKITQDTAHKSRFGYLHWIDRNGGDIMRVHFRCNEKLPMCLSTLQLRRGQKV